MINIYVDKETALKHIPYYYTCPKCNKTYNLYTQAITEDFCVKEDTFFAYCRTVYCNYLFGVVKINRINIK